MDGAFPFLNAQAADALALIDDSGARLSHRELITRASEWRSRLLGPRGLVVLFARNRCEDVAALAGATKGGHPVFLANPELPVETKDGLCSLYGAQWRIDDGELTVLDAPRDDLHPDLFLLLSTSGSTGGAKLVRLSRSAITSNAEDIATAMRIASDEVASGHLPLHYSYGFSILTSHLSRGAAVRLTDHKFISREFWSTVAADGITHLPGVPYHYQMMERLGYDRLDIPKVRLMSQAGGALAQPARDRVHAFMDQRGGRFLVMYGQTEAAPRMSTLSHDEFPLAPASVGRALASGRFTIEDGEVVYEGPNVMMGYAQSRSDLKNGDELAGRLRTGDVGTLDLDGRLTIVGRAKRMGKVYGLRVNLDEVESKANEIVQSAVVQHGDFLYVFFVADAASPQVGDQLKAHLLAGSTLPRTSWKFVARDALPNTERGKVDYLSLKMSI